MAMTSNSGTTIRILLVDDHPLTVEGLQAIIASQPDLEVAGTASTAKQALERYQSLAPNVTLMDLNLPGEDGFVAIRSIRSYDPSARIIVVSTYSGDADIKRALNLGAASYVFKDIAPSVLFEAIRKVSCGEKFLPPQVALTASQGMLTDELTTREVEVLQLIADGKSNAEIAKALFVSLSTAKFHLRNILAKLEVNDRTQAVMTGLRRGIIHVK